MDNPKQTKSDPHDHHDQLPKDVLNNEQDPESFRDPLEVQLAKTGEAPQQSEEGERRKKEQEGEPRNTGNR
ncbi:MAG TPA: hypothetical protein VHK69_02130 [Chitinophagaceae bacterium]|nr:hypothetical protein [Chitinophagaceae bacterium]